MDKDKHGVPKRATFCLIMLLLSLAPFCHAAEKPRARELQKRLDVALLEAATYSDPEATILKSLLARGANINARDNEGNTVLMLRAQRDPYDDDGGKSAKRVLQLVLNLGATIDAKNNAGKTAMLLAAESMYDGHDNGVVRFLLEKGANVNAATNDGTTALMLSYRSAAVARVLLEYGARVDSRDHRGRTPLMFSVNNTEDNFDEPIIKLLLGWGADVNGRDKAGRTPLMYAVEPSVLRFLVRHGATVDARDNEGNTPLFYAHHNPQLMRLLLQRGADINAQNKSGSTTLMRTVFYPAYEETMSYDEKYENTTAFLIARGANPNLRDNKGRTACTIAARLIYGGSLKALGKYPRLEPAQRAALQRGWRTHDLFLAIHDGTLLKARQLLRAGVDISAVWNDQESYADYYLDFGDTPLLAATSSQASNSSQASKQHIAIVRLLLDWGANINARNSSQIGGVTGRTPLLDASASGNAPMARLLLERGADPNLRGERLTPLMSAVRYPAVVRLLLHKGAHLNQRAEVDYEYDSHQWTDLMIAAQWGHPESVQMMLARGARVDERNIAGDTALINALRWPAGYARGGKGESRQTAIVRVLLRGGAKVNAANRFGITPLIMATRYGNVEAVPLLLMRGAQVNAKTSDGWTPLMCATGLTPYAWSSSGANVVTPSPHIVRLLLKKGANPDARNEAGETALIIAARERHLATYRGYTNKVLPDGWERLRAAEQITRLLLTHGANPALRDKKGHTALQWAKANNYGTIAHWLQKAAGRKKAA